MIEIEILYYPAALDEAVDVGLLVEDGCADLVVAQPSILPQPLEEAGRHAEVFLRLGVGEPKFGDGCCCRFLHNGKGFKGLLKSFYVAKLACLLPDEVLEVGVGVPVERPPDCGPPHSTGFGNFIYAADANFYGFSFGHVVFVCYICSLKSR